MFDCYTPEIRAVRKAHLLTGLPDTYGRGRIVGDYRRVALYGIDYIIQQKQNDLAHVGDGTMTDDVIRLREEVAEQIKALKAMKVMAQSYGFDISKPATNAREAFQWLYFGYLSAIKTQNGAAMSVGRISTFLDIYIERDLKNGTLTESEAQELVDHMVMKFRMVKFARIESYNQLFSGDPVWATLEVGGMGQDGRPMVTKNDFRFLHTLENMGPSPEPNLTVLYTKRLPENFKEYAAFISVTTSSIQYENDDVMRPVWGDDYSICCCVSATQTGKEMQFFGARANLAKALLYAINGGKDEEAGLVPGMQIGPELAPITGDVLNYDEVKHPHPESGTGATEANCRRNTDNVARAHARRRRHQERLQRRHATRFVRFFNQRADRLREKPNLHEPRANAKIDSRRSKNDNQNRVIKNAVNGVQKVNNHRIS